MDKDYRAIALALINQRPGITQDSLAIALGMPPRVEYAQGRNRRRFTKGFRRLIEVLIREGSVERRKAQFAGANEAWKFFPAGFQPKKRELFKPVSHHQVKSWVDPSIKGSWEPPLIVNTDWRGDQDDMATKIDKILAAIKAMDIEIPKTDLCRRVGVNPSYISQTPVLRKAYAVRVKELRGQCSQPASHEREAVVVEQPTQLVETESSEEMEKLRMGLVFRDRALERKEAELTEVREELQQLQEKTKLMEQARQALEATGKDLLSRFTELEERNKELRQQLVEAQERPAIAPPVDPQDWIKSQAAYWREQAIQATANAEAFERVLELGGAIAPSNNGLCKLN